MKHETVRASAFAMPLTNPAFHSGPYRFINREYVIIQHRTDPEALRRIVPEPLELSD
jgi:acetoacetate decarboxylase